MSGTTKQTYYIPVGTIPEDEVDDFLKEVVKKLKRTADGTIKLKEEK